MVCARGDHQLDWSKEMKITYKNRKTSIWNSTFYDSQFPIENTSKIMQILIQFIERFVFFCSPLIGSISGKGHLKISE